jgi:hypothetical protein
MPHLMLGRYLRFFWPDICAWMRTTTATWPPDASRRSPGNPNKATLGERRNERAESSVATYSINEKVGLCATAIQFCRPTEASSEFKFVRS